MPEERQLTLKELLDRIERNVETLLARMKKKETVTEKLFKYSPSLAKNLERMEEKSKNERKNRK